MYVCAVIFIINSLYQIALKRHTYIKHTREEHIYCIFAIQVSYLSVKVCVNSINQCAW